MGFGTDFFSNAFDEKSFPVVFVELLMEMVIFSESALTPSGPNS